jgi:hypothetical protein
VPPCSTTSTGIVILAEVGAIVGGGAFSLGPVLKL